MFVKNLYNVNILSGHVVMTSIPMACHPQIIDIFKFEKFRQNSHRLDIELPSTLR